MVMNSHQRKDGEATTSSGNGKNNAANNLERISTQNITESSADSTQLLSSLSMEMQVLNLVNEDDDGKVENLNFDEEKLTNGSPPNRKDRNNSVTSTGVHLKQPVTSALTPSMIPTSPLSSFEVGGIVENGSMLLLQQQQQQQLYNNNGNSIGATAARKWSVLGLENVPSNSNENSSFMDNNANSNNLGLFRGGNTGMNGGRLSTSSVSGIVGASPDLGNIKGRLRSVSGWSPVIGGGGSSSNGPNVSNHHRMSLQASSQPSQQQQQHYHQTLLLQQQHQQQQQQQQQQQLYQQNQQQRSASMSMWDPSQLLGQVGTTGVGFNNVFGQQSASRFRGSYDASNSFLQQQQQHQHQFGGNSTSIFPNVSQTPTLKNHLMAGSLLNDNSINGVGVGNNGSSGGGVGGGVNNNNFMTPGMRASRFSFSTPAIVGGSSNGNGAGNFISPSPILGGVAQIGINPNNNPNNPNNYPNGGGNHSSYGGRRSAVPLTTPNARFQGSAVLDLWNNDVARRHSMAEAAFLGGSGSSAGAENISYSNNGSNRTMASNSFFQANPPSVGATPRKLSINSLPPGFSSDNNGKVEDKDYNNSNVTKVEEEEEDDDRKKDKSSLTTTTTKARKGSANGENNSKSAVNPKQQPSFSAVAHGALKSNGNGNNSNSNNFAATVSGFQTSSSQSQNQSIVTDSGSRQGTSDFETFNVETHPGPVFKCEFKAGRFDYFFIAKSRKGSSGGGSGSGSTLAAINGKMLGIEDFVIVDADRGLDLGKITEIIPIKTMKGIVSSCSGTLQVKRIHRLASPADIQQMTGKSSDEAKALATCVTKVNSRKLTMEVVDAEYQWDRKKLTFYFVSDRRIDFRELVRELFKQYKTRIWMCAVDMRSGPSMLNNNGTGSNNGDDH